MQRTPANPRSQRLTLTCLLALLLAVLTLLVGQPRLVLGVWYEGGILNPLIPERLQAMFDGVRTVRMAFWIVGPVLLALVVLAAMGALDRIARPCSIVILTLLLACAVAIVVVRNEGAKESAFKRALLQD